ncbi:MAG TPA: phosphoenolpyruvate carboxykinase (ATP) [Devosiaceae bacterium]|nr:phosphoenolpyruvate carboxykinase (ATP) [Devosiaceae bacterium]
MLAFDHAQLRAEILAQAGPIARNGTTRELVAQALRAGEAELSADGALTTRTGGFTGRSAKDKFIVREAATEDAVWWDNSQAMAPAHFAALLSDFRAALRGRPLFVQELFAGADPARQMRVTVIAETAWHALFIRNLLIREGAPGAAGGREVTILHLPSFKADPGRHGTRSETVIALDMARHLVLIGGTAYAGEIKKSVFSLFSFHAPFDDVLPMHCSANIGPAGDVALFFGLSGTGKTTLSNDPARRLIGDDEHGWTAEGVFNLEGGCYAKTIRLSDTAEPQIYRASRSFGTVLENVVLNAKGEPDFDDASLTENTRAAYPLETLPAVAAGGVGATPRTVVLLTADAFGVLPPIARLTPEQAVYHFLSGYTAKVAGTERGVTEPQATFSACFGAPFMPLHPTVYGRLLARRLAASGARTFLLNTGWTGGPYGTGRRIDIASTRRLLEAALSGVLDGAPVRIDPAFGLAVPEAVGGVDPALLDPRKSWADPAAYDRQAQTLLGLFARNFEKFGDAAAEIAPARLAAAE